jgi:ABC-type lipoprotein release transport system permease subunit
MGDSKQSVMGTVALLQTASLLLAIVSILLLILSIYSGISMDVVNRQKEVAIRKINGATPKAMLVLTNLSALIARPCNTI